MIGDAHKTVELSEADQDFIDYVDKVCNYNFSHKSAQFLPVLCDSEYFNRNNVWEYPCKCYNSSGRDPTDIISKYEKKQNISMSDRYQGGQGLEVKIPFEIEQFTLSSNDIDISDSSFLTTKEEDDLYDISVLFEELNNIFENCTCNHIECTCSCDRCAKHDENHYYDLGKYKLLKYIKFAPFDKRCNEAEFALLLEEAGHMFYKHNGMEGMINAFTEDFIMDRYYEPIDREWNGIGEWSSNQSYSLTFFGLD